MIVALGQLAAIAIVLGLVGAVCVIVAEFLDGLERTRDLREAAQREAEEAAQNAVVRRRMHGWVPR